MKGFYSGPRAAVTMITKTLRLELSPFGVKAVIVNTGGAGTNNLLSGVNFKVPPTFQYLCIEREIAAGAQSQDGIPRMETSRLWTIS